MKAIVLLFTATLYSVCSAFPIVGDQQSNELCASLAYPQDAASVYVHLCNTPGKGNTRTHFCVLLYTQLYSQVCSPCMHKLLSWAGFACAAICYITLSARLLLQVLASWHTFQGVHHPPSTMQLQWMWRFAVSSTRFYSLLHRMNLVSNSIIGAQNFRYHAHKTLYPASKPMSSLWYLRLNIDRHITIIIVTKIDNSLILALTCQSTFTM